MKKYDKITPLFILLFVLTIMATAVGCSSDRSKFDVSGYTENLSDDIVTSEDIKELVTDDEKLVINYYNAYTWVIYFDNMGSIRYMTYIYSFSDSDEAFAMVDVRKEELEKNKTMTITDAYSVDEFLIVELTDTSFTNISRSVLETNFSGLVVY